MSTATLPRSADLAVVAGPGRGVPDGAARLQKWYIDSRGRKVRTDFPVPVTDDDERTPHLLHTCSRVGKAGTVRCDQREWLLPGVTRYCPQHGAALAAPRPRRSRMLLREAARLHGTSAAPWLLLAGVAATGVYVVAAGVPTLILVPAAAAVVGGVWVLTRGVLTWRDRRAGHIEAGQVDGKRIRRIRRSARAAAAAAAATTGWVLLASVIDPTHGSGRFLWVLLAGGWVLASYPWWARVDQQRQAALASAASNTTQPAPTDVPAQTDPLVTLVRGVWVARIGKPGGVLAGTELVDVVRLPGSPGTQDRPRPVNWAATVRAVEQGSIDMAEQRPNLIGRIAAAYGCSYETVTYHTDPHNRGLAHLRIQPDNVLAGVRPWAGPAASTNWAKGVTVIGRFDDGEPVRYQWFNDQGAAHALITGVNGSGKSGLVRLLILVGLHSGGRVLIWLADPQGGQSYGELKDHVDWLAPNPTEISFMLLAAKKEMLRRNDLLAAANQITWRPTADMPLLVVVLEEATAILSNPVAMSIAEELAEQGRKAGISLVCLTQVGFAYALGGSSIIRSQIVTLQNLIFRASTRSTGHAATDGPGGFDTPIDPTQLPLTWGPGTCNPGATTAGLLYVQGIHGRDVYGRIDFTGDDVRPWLYNDYGQLSITPGTFNSAAQAESGVLWAGRQARRTAALKAGRNDADLLPAGKALELINQAAQLAAMDQTFTTAENPDAGQAGARSTARDRIHTAACDHVDDQGLITRQALIARTPDIADGTRNRIIGDLIADGLLAKVDGPNGRPRQGVYRVNVITSANGGTSDADR
jgi:hypothetical protein